MLYNLSVWFLIFVIYSIIGTIVEILTILIDDRKLITNRGFLTGPYIPIYGVGAIMITFLLSAFKESVLLTFIMSFLLCGFIEFMTSYFMEKVFNARWWDYSKHKFTIQGRIEPKRLIFFGLMGVMILNVLNPILMILISNVDGNVLIFISSLFAVLMIIDFVISIFLAMKFKSSNSIHLDNTEEHKILVKSFFKDINFSILKK